MEIGIVGLGRMGADIARRLMRGGHRGSLAARRRWSVPVTHGRPEMRITLTYAPIQSSCVTAFLVVGEKKAEAVRAVRAGDSALPGARLRPEGELVWLVDRAAAKLI
jgi:6-phosphogluconolactonase